MRSVYARIIRRHPRPFILSLQIQSSVVGQRTLDLKLFYISLGYASVEPVPEWLDSITFLFE